MFYNCLCSRYSARVSALPGSAIVLHTIRKLVHTVMNDFLPYLKLASTEGYLTKIFFPPQEHRKMCSSYKKNVSLFRFDP